MRHHCLVSTLIAPHTVSRVGLFTPEMAFEVIVKRQIGKLLAPALKCVDMVSTELGAVILRCSEGVRHSLCM